MTGRERINATCNHREPDRLAVDFAGGFQTGIHFSTVYQLDPADNLENFGPLAEDELALIATRAEKAYQETADIHNLHFLLQVLVDFIVLTGILGIMTFMHPLSEPVTMPLRHEIETKTSGGVYLAGGAVILAVAVFYAVFW